MADIKQITIDGTTYNIKDETARNNVSAEATARQNADTSLSNQIAALQGAVGSPLVASTASAMTDTTKIYVYTGSESGYTNGNWYYYNGAAWVGGGVYNAVAVSTDTTLSVSGMPADAKVVGDEILADRAALNYELVIGVNKWNPDEETADMVVSNATATLGELVSESGYKTSGFITTVKDDVVRWDYSTAVVSEGAIMARGTNVFRLAEYDSNKNCLLVTSNWASLPYTVQNADTNYVRLSVASRPINSVTFGDSSTSQISYTAYSESVEFERILNIEQSIDDLNDTASLIEIQASTNKWNPNEAQADMGISTSGELVESTGYLTSGYIPILKDQNIIYYYSNGASVPSQMSIGTNAFKVAEYDENKECLSVSANWASVPYTVQNDDTRYVRLQIYGTPAWMMAIVNDNNIYQKPFIPFVSDYNLLTNLSKQVDSLDANTEVILPSAIYGVSGQEINIYKENLVLNNRLRNISYIHTRLSNDAIQDDYRTIWNPSATTLTETNRTWEILKNGLETVESRTIKECIVPKDTGSDTIKVLIIGDSKVDNGYLSYHFLHNFDDDNMSVTLLGSKYDWAEYNRNEGWGGKTAEWFCTNTNSPLSNNGTCDFANYLSTYSIDTPNYVFINLGTNECASASSGYDTAFVTYITQMIQSIHAVSSDIVVIVGMCEGVATVKDTNNAGFENWDLNQKISKLHKATITAFDNRQNENIYVCPMYMGMDLQNDYVMTEVALSKRDGDMNSGNGNGKTRMQITDNVHQNEVGYWKNADYMYAIVKYIVAKSNV